GPFRSRAADHAAGRFTRWRAVDGGGHRRNVGRDLGAGTAPGRDPRTYEWNREHYSSPLRTKLVAPGRSGVGFHIEIQRLRYRRIGTVRSGGYTVSNFERFVAVKPISDVLKAIALDPPAWTRLEPQSVTGDPTPGLEARVHDPLWALARQWQ